MRNSLLFSLSLAMSLAACDNTPVGPTCDPACPAGQVCDEMLGFCRKVTPDMAGNTGDGGLATRATLAGPAGIAVVPDPAGKLTLFIADYYNGKVRAVGPDGVIRDVSDEDRQVFGAPTRVAFGVNRSGSWLYVTDSSKDRLVALSIAKIAPSLLPPTAPVASASLSRWQSIAIALLVVNVLLLYVLVMR